MLRGPLEFTLAAAIGVMDESILGAAAGDRHLDCIGDQLGSEVLTQGPADHFARVAIEHRRQVEPALPTAAVGDVGDPEAVGLDRVPLAADEVGRGGDARDAHRGGAPLAPDQARDALLAHQSSNALSPDVDLATGEHRLHPRGAVGLTRVGMDLTDCRSDHPVSERPLARWAPLRGVEARSRDIQHPTEGGDRVIGPLRADEAVHDRYLRSVSVAKKAAAFLRISRSSRSFRFSFSS